MYAALLQNENDRVDLVTAIKQEFDAQIESLRFLESGHCYYNSRTKKFFRHGQIRSENGEIQDAQPIPLEETERENLLSSLNYTAEKHGTQIRPQELLVGELLVIHSPTAHPQWRRFELTDEGRRLCFGLQAKSLDLKLARLRQPALAAAPSRAQRV